LSTPEARRALRPSSNTARFQACHSAVFLSWSRASRGAIRPLTGRCADKSIALGKVLPLQVFKDCEQVSRGRRIGPLPFKRINKLTLLPNVALALGDICFGLPHWSKAKF
jgi:hypothetical protein